MKHRIDRKKAIEVATDKLIEYMDPHHAYERSYWEAQAEDIVTNVFAFGLVEAKES
jgi:hypothetical protein